MIKTKTSWKIKCVMEASVLDCQMQREWIPNIRTIIFGFANLCHNIWILGGIFRPKMFYIFFENYLSFLNT